MTDAETAAAIEALAYRLRQRDAAMNDGEDYADPEVFAREYLTAMRGYGWRHTEAKVFTAPKPAPAEVPSLKPETADLRASLRADMEARAARDRAAKEGVA